MSGPIRPGLPWAGLFVGPASWAASFQGNYTLVPWQCANAATPVPWISLAACFVSLAAAVVSCLAWRASRRMAALAPAARTRAFVAVLGMGAGVLFAMVLLLQTLAGALFHGCEL